jgi:hypothetical protein
MVGPHVEGKLDAEEDIEIAAFLALCLIRRASLDVVAVTIQRTPSMVRCTLWTRNCESAEGDDTTPGQELKEFLKRRFLG